MALPLPEAEAAWRGYRGLLRLAGERIPDKSFSSGSGIHESYLRDRKCPKPGNRRGGVSKSSDRFWALLGWLAIRVVLPAAGPSTLNPISPISPKPQS